MLQISTDYNLDNLSSTSRNIVIGEVVLLLLLLVFFGSHLVLVTGFFNNKFGIIDFILFFGFFLINLCGLILRFVLNSKNSTRSLRLLTNILSIFFILGLLLHYPFDPNRIGSFIPILGTVLDSAALVYGTTVLQALIFFFGLFTLYDAILLVLAADSKTSQMKNVNMTTINGH